MGRLNVETEVGIVSVSIHAQERWLDRGDGRSIVDAIKDCRRLRIVDPGTIWLGDEQYAFPISIRDMVVSTAMPIDFARTSFRKRTGRPFAEAPAPVLQTATINEIRRWLDLPADVVLLAAAGKSKSSVAVANKIAALKRQVEDAAASKIVPAMDVVGMSAVVQASRSDLPSTPRRRWWNPMKWFDRSSGKTECA